VDFKKVNREMCFHFRYEMKTAAFFHVIQRKIPDSPAIVIIIDLTGTTGSY